MNFVLDPNVKRNVKTATHLLGSGILFNYNETSMAKDAGGKSPSITKRIVGCLAHASTYCVLHSNLRLCKHAIPLENKAISSRAGVAQRGIDSRCHSGINVREGLRQKARCHGPHLVG